MAMEWRPHFYRTPWFFLLCLVSLGAAVWGAHQFQMHQAHARFEGVLEERSRVAREMHDTLIQGCGSISALLEASFALGTPQTARNANCWNTPATRCATPWMKRAGQSGTCVRRSRVSGLPPC